MNAMTRQAYIEHLLTVYTRVSVLSKRNGCTVYRLRHKQHGKDLVLRSFDTPVAVYDILRGIRCENLPMIYDTIACDDGQIVLEEYIDGITVAAVMESGRYRYRGAKMVLRAVCQALTVLHERGIVHRDVKPENILVDTNGRVVLLDFNASREISGTSKDTVAMGTIGYASPEQLGVAESDARSDVYAVGVLLNIMLTGKHPGEKVAHGRAGHIVKTCTMLAKDDRFPTAAALSRAL